MSDETLKEFIIHKQQAFEDIKNVKKQQNFIIKYTWNQIIELSKQYKQNTIQYLILAINILIPPRRKDWCDAIFVETMPEVVDKTKNYVVIGKEYVELNFYKSKIGKYTNEWCRVLKNDNFEYLQHSEYFNPEKLGELLKASYKKKPRVNVFNYRSQRDKVYRKNELEMDFNQDDIRHSFAEYIWNKQKISNHQMQMITNDFADVKITTFRGYSTVREEPEPESIPESEPDAYIDSDDAISISTESCTEQYEDDDIQVKHIETQTEAFSNQSNDIDEIINKNNLEIIRLQNENKMLNDTKNIIRNYNINKLKIELNNNFN